MSMAAPPRIRVQLVIDSLTHGGAEMLLSDFALGAPKAGIDLAVAYLAEREESAAAAPLRAAGIEPVLLPMTRLWNPAGLWRVRRHLARTRPDLVHTHLAYADLLGGLAARSLGIPAVSTLHVMEWEGGRRESVKGRLFAWARRRCAARVIAVSETARRAYLETGWDAPEHVETVHNGIAREAEAGAGPAVRAELGIGADEVVAATISVLRAGKGHDAAIAAVGALRARHPRLRLLIVGTGPARPEIERLAAPLGAAAVLTGHRADVMRVLDAVDVVVHPSRVDAFPTALLEAMAAGVPVVATAVGGIPEIVEPGRTGILVDAPPDVEALTRALEGLVADPALRRRLGEAGRERRGREFTAEHWARRTRAVYEAALGRRGAAASVPPGAVLDGAPPSQGGRRRIRRA